MDNCVLILKKTLRLLKVNYTNNFLRESILSHPDYPSLLAISDTLESYGVDNRL